MRGHLEPRGNGYRITVRLGKDEKTGKYLRVTETITGPAAKDRAKKRITQILADYDKGIITSTKKLTVRQYLRDWLEDVIKPNRATDTYESYSGIANKHIIPEIGNIALTKLTKQHLQHLYAVKKEAGLTRTVVLIHAIMHEALKNAIPDLLVRNVASEVEVPKYHKKEFKPLSASEIHLVLEYARDTPYFELFYTYIFTGMRRGELLALRWSDIDLDSPFPVAHINRTMQYIKGKDGKQIIDYKEPKTPGSRRTVELTPSNVTMLKEYKEACNKARKELRLPLLTPEDLVFCYFDGKPYTPDGISHSWMKLVRKCGLAGIRLHDARHSFATIHLKSGTHPKIVQEMLGHAKISTTLDTYSHLIPGMQREAAKKFDEMLLPKE